MLIAVDIDGTIDAWPRELQSVMQALQAAGHTVQVVTGTEQPEVTPEDLAEKAAYLTALGCGECYSALVVIPPPHDENKAAYLREVGADVLIDNSIPNAKAASDVCLVLVPWQSRVKE